MFSEFEKRWRSLRDDTLPEPPNEDTWRAIQQRLQPVSPAPRATYWRYRRWLLLLPLLLLGTCGYWSWQSKNNSVTVVASDSAVEVSTTNAVLPIVPHDDEVSVKKSSSPVRGKGRLLPTMMPTSTGIDAGELTTEQALQIQPPVLIAEWSGEGTRAATASTVVSDAMKADITVQPVVVTKNRILIAPIESTESQVVSTDQKSMNATGGPGKQTLRIDAGKRPEDTVLRTRVIPTSTSADTTIASPPQVMTTPANGAAASGIAVMPSPPGGSASNSPSDRWMFQLDAGVLLGRERIGIRSQLVDNQRLDFDGSRRFLQPGGGILAMQLPANEVEQLTLRELTQYGVGYRIRPHWPFLKLMISQLQTAAVSEDASLGLANGFTTGIREAIDERYSLVGLQSGFTLRFFDEKLLVQSNFGFHRTVAYQLERNTYAVCVPCGLDYQIQPERVESSTINRSFFSIEGGVGVPIGKKLDLFATIKRFSTGPRVVTRGNNYLTAGLQVVFQPGW